MQHLRPAFHEEALQAFALHGVEEVVDVGEGLEALRELVLACAAEYVGPWRVSCPMAQRECGPVAAERAVAYEYGLMGGPQSVGMEAAEGVLTMSRLSRRPM